jgi:hypothetical protein
MAPDAAITDLVDLFERSAERHGHREMFGVKRGGRWTFTSYADVKKQVDDLRGDRKSVV